MKHDLPGITAELMLLSEDCVQRGFRSPAAELSRQVGEEIWRLQPVHRLMGLLLRPYRRSGLPRCQCSSMPPKAELHTLLIIFADTKNRRLLAIRPFDAQEFHANPAAKVVSIAA